ncbi:MAG: aminodeoxychorismate lyase [Lachnospiraceae bacterium]|nr:aminodeoxychorismate lyase [Lachnospiraceae bacterium]
MAAKKNNDLGYRIIKAGFQSVIRILIYILLAVILFVLGKESYSIGYQVVNTTPVAKENGVEVTVTITDDMSVKEIGQLLADWGLIEEQPISFVIQEMLSEYHNKILPGTYVLSTGMTVDEMLQIMAASDEEDSEETQP